MMQADNRQNAIFKVLYKHYFIPLYKEKNRHQLHFTNGETKNTEKFYNLSKVNTASKGQS